MFLDDVKNALKEIDPLVFYGIVPATLVDENGDAVDVWDYIVFNRSKLKSNPNKTSFNDRFEVHIVREEYVPEGIDIAVIEKLTAIPGVKLADEDGTFDYIMKPNTDTVIEMLTLTFTRGRKDAAR